jgi:hypothetical protein
MHSRLIFLFLVLFGHGLAGAVLFSSGDAWAEAGHPGGSLVAFSSEAELRAYLRKLRKTEELIAVPVPVMAAPPPSAPMAEPVTSVSASDLAASAPAQAAPGITNNQEAGVDEGDIVKVRGDTLVILRRGRLFTVSLAGGGMRPVDTINAFPPGVSGEDDWYDEMLVSGDRIIVVGYSYERGGTEVNRFRLDPAGRLRFEDAWHLKSNDYYSSRNYASRLIGNKLVFYTPLYLEWDKDPLEALPAMRRWRGDSKARFKRIATPRQIYIVPAMRRDHEAEVDTLHSVTTCDLTVAELDCTATGVLGPESRTFYVSPDAVYLWVTDDSGRVSKRQGPDAFVYRLPFANERPSAVAARGAPVDQFSFREDRAAGLLNVLVRSEGGGDAMFLPEVTGEGVALLRLRIADFSDGSREAPRARYRVLPDPEGENWSFHNRFAGDYILYGAGEYGEERQKTSLFAAPLAGGPVEELALPHAIGRIELMGGDAVVVGETSKGLGFTTVELFGTRPRLGERYILPNAAEGETRSHAFFFNPDVGSANGASGTLGLPVARRADPALARFFGSSAAMVFLRRDERRLSPAGELAARAQGVVDDACQASCTDWYGNARPIFLRGRTFALLGYELVEGRVERGRIREVGRTSFAPIGRPRD